MSNVNCVKGQQSILQESCVLWLSLLWSTKAPPTNLSQHLTGMSIPHLYTYMGPLSPLQECKLLQNGEDLDFFILVFLPPV